MNTYTDVEKKFHDLFSQTQNTAPSWHQKTRQLAFDTFKQQGFPTRKVENWKYTSLAKLLATEFETQQYQKTIDMNEINLPQLSCHRLVFINGEIDQTLSDRTFPKGLKIETLENTTFPLEKYFGKSIEASRHPLANLNLALANSGTIIHCEKNTKLEKPLHIIFIGAGKTEYNHYQLTLLDENAECDIIRQFVNTDKETQFGNHINEVILNNQSKHKIYNIQTNNRMSFHVDGIHVKQDEHSEFECITLDLGSQLSRTDIDVKLNGKHSRCTLNGFYYPTGKQHIDNHNRIDHCVAECQSSEIYKGILDDQGRAVFNGKIVIHQDAQKTQTHQLNKNLLLSNRCEIDTKPELEIYADDVKASHGATSGQLDKNALFYMQARGISSDAAKQLLIDAFSFDVLQTIQNKSIRKWFENCISTREVDDE
ncbi:MAG: Fe-S cluster assembly protein SufD [Gammaproteobacteria bacterium]